MFDFVHPCPCRYFGRDQKPRTCTPAKNIADIVCNAIMGIGNVQQAAVLSFAEESPGVIAS